MKCGARCRDVDVAGCDSDIQSCSSVQVGGVNGSVVCINYGIHGTFSASSGRLETIMSVWV